MPNPSSPRESSITSPAGKAPIPDADHQAPQSVDDIQFTETHGIPIGLRPLYEPHPRNLSERYQVVQFITGTGEGGEKIVRPASGGKEFSEAEAGILREAHQFVLGQEFRAHESKTAGYYGVARNLPPDRMRHLGQPPRLAPSEGTFGVAWRVDGEAGLDGYLPRIIAFRAEK